MILYQNAEEKSIAICVIFDAISAFSDGKERRCDHVSARFDPFLFCGAVLY